MDFPLLAKAVVIGQDPDNYQLIVSVLGRAGGQAPALRVGILTHGPRDGVRGTFPEMPMPGTWGIVAFPSADGRNGHWMGSSEPAQIDASPGAPATTFPRYAAHYAGGWSYTGPDGTTAEALADGSYLLSGTSLPAPTRHTIDGNQVRQRTAFSASQRNPNPPGPYPASFVHKSGASFSVTAAGAVTLSAAAGQAATISANGATITIGAAGQVTVTAASGEPLTLTASGASLTFDGAGNATLEAAGGVKAVLAGAVMTVSAGGTAHPVETTVGPSSTLAAQ